IPQPAFSVNPASWTFLRMLSIESRMVPDTVQLIVEVAGLCSSAPALEVTRPAGMAPRRSAHRKRSFQWSRTSSRSTSASARATRLYVSSIVLSMGAPSLALRRYFLSQISSDASWNGMASISFGSIFTTVFMCSAALRLSLARPLYGSQGIRPAQKFAVRRVTGLPARCSCSRKPPEPPRTPDLVEPPRGHKILCRGKEPNEHSGRRQDSRTYFIGQNLPCKNSGLQQYWL